MASCINCSKKVGCGCNLNKEMLCATCVKEKKSSTPKEIPKPKLSNGKG